MSSGPTGIDDVTRQLLPAPTVEPTADAVHQTQSSAVESIQPTTTSTAIETTLVLAPFASGTIGTSDGLIVVSVPNGAFGDVMIVNITTLDTLAVQPDPDDGLVPGRMMTLSAFDSDGNPITAFAVPLTVSVQLSLDDLAAVDNDPTRFLLALRDADDGLWLPSPAAVDGTGRMSSPIDRTGTYALMWTSDPPAQEGAPGR